MSKICQRCGMKNEENAPFCKKCGTRFVETLADFRSSIDAEKNEKHQQSSNTINNNENNKELKPDYQVYNQTPPFINQKKSKNRKLVIALIAVIVAVMLIAVTFFILFTDEKEEESELDKILKKMGEKVDGGPSVNMQSLASGNFQSIPDDGLIAKYYLYSEGEKVGETYETNAGKTTYNGVNCNKILGRSNLKLNNLFLKFEFTTEYTYYVNAENNFPIIMFVDYDYNEPYDIETSATFTWNKDTGDIKLDLPGTKQDITYNFPIEYLGALISIDDFYVGYSKNIDYTMTQYETTTPMDITISVKNQDDVTVQAGTFEDCYLLQLSPSQSQSNIIIQTTSLKLWISKEGYVPKIITTYSDFDLTQELEGYYTTK